MLSEPLDLSKAPWEICLVPRLEDGRVGMVGKIHHSLVDGMAALQVVSLFVDEPEQGNDVAVPSGNGPRMAPSTSSGLGPLQWAVHEAAHVARAGLGVTRSLVGATVRPVSTAGSVVRDARSFVDTALTDVLPRAPDSPLDTPLSPHRTLVGYRAQRSLLRDARATGRRHAQRHRADRGRRCDPPAGDRARAAARRAAEGNGPGEHAGPGRGRPR